MKKVLIILTNIEKYQTEDRLTGLWLSELTHFYDEMMKAGIAVDFVSPEGGYVPLDPHSLAKLDETDWKYYKNSTFRKRALGETMAASDVNPTDYDVIYYTGGHGTMWDFPQENAVAKLASKIYQKGGIVASVCHGAAGLLPIKDENGDYLISGKKVAGFSNQEESLNQTTDIVPFLTQDELVSRGGNYQEGTPFTSFVVTDERLISGQNPQSARAVGQAVVNALQ